MPPFVRSLPVPQSEPRQGPVHLNRRCRFFDFFLIGIAFNADLQAFCQDCPRIDRVDADAVSDPPIGQTLRHVEQGAIYRTADGELGTAGPSSHTDDVVD